MVNNRIADAMYNILFSFQVLLDLEVTVPFMSTLSTVTVSPGSSTAES